MNTKDEIIRELAAGQSLTMRNLVDRLGKNITTIHGHANKLIDAGLVTATDTRPAMLAITGLGKDYFESDAFGQEGGAEKAAVADESVTIGYFTNGELHVSVGGKSLKLNRAQAAQLVEFVCSLPSKLFSDTPRPTMASLPGRVVRAE